MQNKPIHILHVLQTHQFAGTEAHVLTLMLSLNPQQTRVSLLCRLNSPLHKKAEQLGVSCFTTDSLAGFVRLLRSQHFSLIHAHDGDAKLKAVLGMRLSMSKVKVITTQHFLSPAYTHRSGWKKILSSAMHRLFNLQVAMSIAVSQAVREAALARNEIASSKIVVIPNGISALSIPDKRLTQDSLRDLNISAKAIVVCTVARLAKEKGISYLLNAIPQVLAAVPHAIFLLIGDGPERQALQAETTRLEITHSVVFAGFRDDIHVLLAGCQLFVLPSPAEPFGLAILEAMSLAKPVVAARAGGPIEIIEDKVTGLLAEPADAQSLAACILTLLTNRNRSMQMGEAGQKRLYALFSAQVMARSTEAVYESTARS